VGAAAKSRKFIIGTANASETMQLNLEDKVRADLLEDLAIPQKK
jgi:hypothetical protein